VRKKNHDGITDVDNQILKLQERGMILDLEPEK
jgi:hypothetical protein